MPRSTIAIGIAALAAATVLLVIALWWIFRRVRKAGDCWADTQVRLIFSAPIVQGGVAVAFLGFFMLLAGSFATVGKRAEALRLTALMIFVLFSWAGMLLGLYRHLTLKQQPAEDVVPADLATAPDDAEARWPREPSFAYPRSRLAAIAAALLPSRLRLLRSLSMTGDGIYVFDGATPDRFVPWIDVASVSELWEDGQRHFLAPRDVTINLLDGTVLPLSAGVGHHRRALNVLLLHARRLGIPLYAVDRRARTLATAKRMRSAAAYDVLRRTGVVCEIAEFWQERVIYKRTDGAPRT